MCRSCDCSASSRQRCSSSADVGLGVGSNFRQPWSTVFFVFSLKVKDVSALAELSSLQTLNLDRTGVSEASLRCLATLPALTFLTLADIPVTDGNDALQIIAGR